jgi:hypothetical protein
MKQTIFLPLLLCTYLGTVAQTSTRPMNCMPSILTQVAPTSKAYKALNDAGYGNFGGIVNSGFDLALKCVTRKNFGMWWLGGFSSPAALNNKTGITTLSTGIGFSYITNFDKETPVLFMLGARSVSNRLDLDGKSSSLPTLLPNSIYTRGASISNTSINIDARVTFLPVKPAKKLNIEPFMFGGFCPIKTSWQSNETYLPLTVIERNMYFGLGFYVPMTLSVL